MHKENIKNLVKIVTINAERIGLKLNISFLIYTIILCCITISFDRMYVEWKLKKAVNNAFGQMDKLLTNDTSVKKDKKKKKFFAPKPKIVNVGEIINTDTIEVTIHKAGFITKLLPPRIREWSYYTYYEAKDKENTLIDMVVNVKNLDTTETNTENIFQEIKAIYNSKYEYEGFGVVEYSDGSDFDSNSTISPLQTRKMHILVEIPKIAKTDTSPVDIVFDVNDKTYILPIKLQKELVDRKQTVIQVTANQEDKKEEIQKETVKQVVTSEKKVNKTTRNPIQTNKNKQNIKPVKSNIQSAEEMLFN